MRRSWTLLLVLSVLTVGVVAPLAERYGPTPSAAPAAAWAEPSAAASPPPSPPTSDPAPVLSPAAPSPAASPEPPPASPQPPPASPQPPAASPEPVAQAPAVLLRGIGAIPAGLVDRVAAISGAGPVATVRAGSVLLTGSRDAAGSPVDTPPPGWGLPLEVIAVDPASYGAVLPAGTAGPLRGLVPGTVLLGATSARLRGLGPGAALDVGGVGLTVAGVVDDALIGSAEAVVGTADADRLGLGGPRYVLVRADGDPDGVLAQVRALATAHERVQATGLGPAPWRTSWREVLPQAVVKERFGEFAIAPGGGGRAMDQQAGWADAHIVSEPVPLLGEVSCHRAILPPLRAALGELEAAGLGHLVDRGDYAGCFSPRLIGPGAGPSRHAWGLAVDLNASRNPFGAPSQQDARLVEIMERHGFGFGGRWPVPDAMHFEYRGRPG